MKKEIDKLAWINIKNRKILSAVSKGKETYYIPGGKRDPGESDQESLVREIKEELSVDLLTSTISYFETYKGQAHGKEEGVMVKITCYTADYEGEIRPDSEIEKAIWIDSSDREKSSLVTQLLIDDLVKKDLID